MSAFVDLENLPEIEPFPGLRAQIVHSEQMTFGYWRIAAGSVLPEHHHLQEQVATMIDGELELTVDGDTRVLSAGQVAVIPSNAKHSGRALTDCRVIDVWQPRRDDLG